MQFNGPVQGLKYFTDQSMKWFPKFELPSYEAFHEMFHFDSDDDRWALIYPHLASVMEQDGAITYFPAGGRCEGLIAGILVHNWHRRLRSPVLSQTSMPGQWPHMGSPARNSRRKSMATAAVSISLSYQQWQRHSTEFICLTGYAFSGSIDTVFVATAACTATQALHQSSTSAITVCFWRRNCFTFEDTIVTCMHIELSLSICAKPNRELRLNEC